MCPLWPLHLLVMYALLLFPLMFVSCGVAAQVADRFASPDVSAEALSVIFESAANSSANISAGISVEMGGKYPLKFTVTDLDPEDIRYGELYTQVHNQDLADTEPKTFPISQMNIEGPTWSSAFNVSGLFLGFSDVNVCLRKNKLGDVTDRCSKPLALKVIREKRFIDKVFTGSVAALVAIIFINFGCALDWPVIKATIRRPIGPIIGFCSQYVIMPVVSFGLAQLIFPNSVALQLGMFFTGVSPGGGASNIWTYILGGNLNLSITMTTLSTLLSFLMMPAWIFTLGQLIFTGDRKLEVPYARVAEVAGALVVPVFIGWLLQRYCPRVSKFMVRILKPFSALLIAFIVIFAIITNIYIFRLFSWRIVIAGVALPWLGYICGLLLAMILRQKPEDMLAISVETGVHNTGISIFMLTASLGKPEGDLATVVPVAIAIMTPIPLTIAYVVKRLRARWTLKKKDHIVFKDEALTSSEPLTIITANGKANNNHDKY